MGKYSTFFPQTQIVGDIPWQVAMITAITQNNNELAEANRLKREELKLLKHIHQESVEIQKCNLTLDLEDKA